MEPGALWMLASAQQNTSSIEARYSKIAFLDLQRIQKLNGLILLRSSI
jgi:hypothetical protein